MYLNTLIETFRRGTLFADSFLRLTNRQRYAIITKIINRYLLGSIPSPASLEALPKPWRAKQRYSIDDHYSRQLRLDMENLLRLPGDNRSIWSLSDKPAKCMHAYQRALRGKLSAYVAGDEHGLWDASEADIEILCNYQRFYLFDTTLADIPEWPSWAFRLIADWIDRNPPSRNNAWDSFNCAVRLINWIKLLHDIPGVAYPDRRYWEKILHSIATQMRRVHRGFIHEVPGNHVIIELFALWLSASLFKNIKEAESWKTSAGKRLAAEIDSQFLASGFHCEHSVHYHAQVTLMSLFWLHASEAQGAPVPGPLRKIIRHSCSLTRCFVLPDGSLPLFGDGCYSFFHESLGQDVENIHNLSSRVFPDIMPTSQNPQTYTTSDIYPYIVSSSAADMLIADVGNIGLRNNPGHGHSDMLSFIYCSRGLPIMIDPGTRAYANNPESLQLKRADHHNTISVDNADQARLWGYFRWAFLPDDPSYKTTSSSAGCTLEAQFRGFKHIGGVTHKRVFRMKTGELLIDDSVTFSGTRDISINFILHPSIKVTRRDRQSLILSSGLHRWMLEYSGKFAPSISVLPIEAYMQYSMPVPSHRISIACKHAVNSLESRVALRYQPA